jgi:hypothetical protein
MKAEPRAVGHVAAPELPSQEGSAQSPGTRDSVGAHLSKEARFGAEGHVTASELTSVRRRGTGSQDTWRCGPKRDTWRCRSSSQQGGVVQGRGTHDSSGVYLCREVWSKAIAYVAVRECTPCTLS